MKRILYILSSFAIICIAAWFFLTTPLLGSDKVTNQNFANKDSLYRHVEVLTMTAESRNVYHVTTLDSIAKYIDSKFQSYGYQVENQEYEADYKKYRNVIASYGLKDAPRLIVGAHYDVCGEQDGADDNASGIAGLLELARLIQLQKPDLPYRIDFVAYTLEEPPYFRSEFMGSAVHAKYLHDNDVKVLGMVCLEMIGYFTDQPHSQGYPSPILKLFYPSTGDFITVVGKIGQGSFLRNVKKSMVAGSDIRVKSINAPAFIPGIDFSDHLNYWKYNYDAVMITNTAFYRNKRYHEAEDTIETLDFNRMKEVVNGVYNAITTLR